MKKVATLCLLCLLMAAVLCLTGCGECEHQWQEANCEAAKTCTLCGVTEGAALGHSWKEADCETAKICTVCEKNEGEALGHIWQLPTCETAKTCSVCNATEGEALGHNLQEANYQAPASCNACGYTQGEPLPAAYASYPVEVIAAQTGVEYDYKTACYISGHTTVGKLQWENYRVFTSDETHEAVEGYEWHSVTVKIVFSDKDAQRYGFIVQSALDDYYWVTSEDDNGYTDRFTVSYHGVLYDQCLMANGYGSVTDWVDDTCTYTAEFAWRVPVGYDAYLILFYNAAIDLGDALENGDESVLVFRFAE